MELGSYSCRLPWPGRPSEWVQPAVGSLSTSEESGWVVRVGLLMPKTTEGLFELDARFRSRPVRPQGWRWSRRASRASESIQRPVPIQPQVPKPPRCASTPPRLIVFYMLLILVGLKLIMINLYLLVLFVIHYQYQLYYQLFHHLYLILYLKLDLQKIE